MSGIVGLWNFDGAPVQRTLLERMAATIHHRGPDATGIWTEGPAGLAACLLRVTPESQTEVQPLIAPSEAVVVFDGRLDNREEILAGAQNSDRIDAASPDPALVLAAYRRHGEKFVEHLNGDFALGVFDMRKRELFLARDYLGIRPLYHARIGSAFIFASEIKAILAYPAFPRSPNEDALAFFLAQGISQDVKGQTLFSNVYDCPPAHLLAVTPRKTSAKRYWSFEKMSAQPVKLSRDYFEGFRWHFEQAVRRRIRSAYPVAVSVSGGLDSSSIFCVAETFRRNARPSAPPIKGVSLIYSDASPADEKHFLAAIERKYGVTISRVPTAAAPFGSVSSIRHGIWHAEIPLLSGQWNECLDFYKTVVANGARVVLHGDWGDQALSDPAHLVDLFNDWRFIELMARLRSFPQWTADVDPQHHRRQFLQDLFRYQKRHLPSSVVRCLRKLRGRHALPAVYSDALKRRSRLAAWRQKTHAASKLSSFHAQSLSITTESEYFLSGSEESNKVAAMHGVEISFPIADRDMIGFLMGIPPEVYSAGAVPRGLHRQAMRGVVPDEILDRHEKADFTNYVNESMSSQYAGIVSLLQGSSMVLKRGYVDQGSLGLELERLRAQIEAKSPSCVAAWNLQRLSRLELWLQVFFSEVT